MQNHFKEFKVNLKKRAASDLGKAYNCLENNISDYSDYYNTIIYQIGRYNEIIKESSNGTVSFEIKDIVLNRLRKAFNEFVDELEEYDFDSFDITKNEPIDRSFKRKTKELKNSIDEIEKQSWKKKYLWLLIPFTLLALLIGRQFGQSDSLKTTKKIDDNNSDVESTFNQLFQKGEIFPYSDVINLPCFSYQGKWELDEKAPYVLSILLNQGRGIYYYKAKSLHFYSWCDKQDTLGNRLKGIEIFTNELWKDTQGRDLEITVDSLNSISEGNGYIKIANISSLFTNEIDFIEDTGVWKPATRSGEKIIRYTPTEIRKGYKKEIDDVLTKFLGKLNKTNCSNVTYEGLNTKSRIPVKIDSTILQFNCEFSSIKDAQNTPVEYKKRIIFKGNKKPMDNKG